MKAILSEPDVTAVTEAREADSRSSSRQVRLGPHEPIRPVPGETPGRIVVADDDAELLAWVERRRAVFERRARLILKGIGPAFGS